MKANSDQSYSCILHLYIFTIYIYLCVENLGLIFLKVFHPNVPATFIYFFCLWRLYFHLAFFFHPAYNTKATKVTACIFPSYFIIFLSFSLVSLSSCSLIVLISNISLLCTRISRLDKKLFFLEFDACMDFITCYLPTLFFFLCV